MRPLVHLLTILTLLFGFQAGIVTSAACGAKGLTLLAAPSDMPGDADDGGALAPEVPSPSCKSMTTASEIVLHGPLDLADAPRIAVLDGRSGLWRTLAIDEPPKLISRHS